MREPRGRVRGETKFEINSGTSTVAVAANSTVYTWGGLAPSTYLCLRVRAVNAAGASAWTPYACAITPGPPAAPTLYNTVAQSPTSVTVVWFDNSINETDRVRMTDTGPVRPSHRTAGRS